MNILSVLLTFYIYRYIILTRISHKKHCYMLFSQNKYEILFDL